MIFDGKPTRDITIGELRQLVEDNVAEDSCLDFKREDYPQTPGGTKELLKDITAFANADGGYIILKSRSISILEKSSLQLRHFWLK